MTYCLVPRSLGGLVLALAPALAFSLPQPQNGIALVRECGGQAVYVNASPPPIPAPAKALNSQQPTPEIRRLIGSTARSLEVDPALVDAVMRVESGYQPAARSPKGALGLMQLIPATAARFGVQNPFDPAENIRGGVAYLGELLKLYDGSVPLTLAAFNAGEGAVQRFGGVPPFNETRNYVRRITALYPTGGPGRLTPDSPAALTMAGGAGTEHGFAPAVGAPIAARRHRISGPSGRGDNPAAAVPIYRYVDSEGTIHFEQ